jgi:hypothetical protein
MDEMPTDSETESGGVKRYKSSGFCPRDTVLPFYPSEERTAATIMFEKQ